MAEILGVIGGGIAIVQALSAARIATLKLRRLRTELYEMPAEIDDFLEQLEFIRLSLEISENGLREQRRHGTIADPRHQDATYRSIARCHKALSELGHLVDAIRARATSRSFWSRTKAAWQKDDMKNLNTKLEQAIRFLSFSQTMCTGVAVAKLESGFMTINQQVSSELKRIDRGLYAIEERITKVEYAMEPSADPITCSQEHEVAQLLGDPAFGDALQMPWVKPSRYGQFRYHRSPRGFEIRIIFPGWYTQLAWDLQVRRAEQGWKAWFEPFTYSPNEQELMYLIARDRVMELEYLFRKRRANPRSRVLGGKASLILFASFVGAVDSALMLQDAFVGRDAWSIGDHGVLFFEWASLPICSAVIKGTLGPAGPLSARFSILGTHGVLYHCSGSFPEYDTEISALLNRLWEVFGNSGLLDRIATTSWIRFESLPEPFQFQGYLATIAPTDGTLTSDMIVEPMKSCYTLLTTVSYWWGWNLAKLGGRPPHWSAVARNIVTSTSSIPYLPSIWRQYPASVQILTFGFECTFLIRMVRGVIDQHSLVNNDNEILEQVRRALLAWLDFLSECNVDLIMYGEAEAFSLSRMHLASPEHSFGTWEHITCHEPDCFGTPSTHKNEAPPVRLKEFRFGPTPADWEFYFQTEDERVEVFWRMVEKQMEEESQHSASDVPGLPGAWVE